MSKTVELSDQQAKEFAEFLQQKINRLQDEINETRSVIAKINGGSKTAPQNGGGKVELKQPTVKGTPFKATFGWKSIVDEILMKEGKPMSAAQITERYMQDHKDEASDTARKSIGSALSTNSTEQKQRYLWKTENGIKFYYLNEKYKGGRKN